MKSKHGGRGGSIFDANPVALVRNSDVTYSLRTLCKSLYVFVLTLTKEMYEYIY